MRKLARTAGLAAAVFTIAVPALGAGVKPKPDDYEATPKANGTVTLGVFRVTKDEQAKFHMVVDPQYNGIYYPDAGKCDNFAVGLSGTEYPISNTGRFSINDTREIEGKDMEVEWKGHWTAKTKLEGTTKISYGNCTDKRDFTGRKATFSR